VRQPAGVPAVTRAEPRPGVVAFVPDAWGDAWMPRHQILTRLARYFPVVWMNPPWEWRQALTSLAPRRRPPDLPRNRDFLFYRPGHLLPLIYRPAIAARVLEMGRIARARSLLASRGAEPAVLYLWRPEFAPMLDRVPHRVSCYHIDDEYSFSPTEQPQDAAEAALLQRVDQVVIHSPALWEKKRHLAKRAAFITNGVDYAAYATSAPEPADLQSIPRPRVGYVGVIKGQLDIPLLVALARRHRDWSFVLVGPVRSLGTDEAAYQELARLPNVHPLGARPVAALPAYTQHVDVALMPYDLDDYTKYIYPLKLHEYLAAGVPVVGTPIRTLRDFGEVVSLASSPDEWSAAIEASLAPAARRLDAVAARRAVAARYDWGALTQEIALLFGQRLGAPWDDRIAAAVQSDRGASTAGA
jgi:glycosyltransferase involved in cell wall biosynthesis